jgi:hypothetical protein
MSRRGEVGAVECRGCNGQPGRCTDCGGSGTKSYVGDWQTCKRCGGNGVCPGCRGSGWIVVPVAPVLR